MDNIKKFNLKAFIFQPMYFSGYGELFIANTMLCLFTLLSVIGFILQIEGYVNFAFYEIILYLLFGFYSAIKAEDAIDYRNKFNIFKVIFFVVISPIVILLSALIILWIINRRWG
ncbi:MAG: hypothetical protein N4A44_04460 [Alphaproteobacteria bacterium]|jgi:hypothetical protein|nr:hypothetical protein [Alphaproteobacteria bacterium]